MKFDHTTATPDWTDVWGVELYDHRTEVGLFNNENINLANNASFVAVKSELRAALMTGWKASIPIQSESPSTDKPKTAMSAASSTAQAKSSTEGSTKQTKSTELQLNPSIVVTLMLLCIARVFGV